MSENDLRKLPNIGPAMARMLTRLGVEQAEDLRGRDPEQLFQRLCEVDGRRHDPCVLDTLTAAVDYANGAPARPWWFYSRQRKAREASGEEARLKRLPPRSRDHQGFKRFSSLEGTSDMQARLDLIGLVVQDMAQSLAFYRQLGVELPPDADQQPHVETTLPTDRASGRAGGHPHSAGT